MKIKLLFLILYFLLSCKKERVTEKQGLENVILKKATETIEVNKMIKNDSKISNHMILGVWTNGSTENATFEIKSNTIYYVDDFKDYNYSLQNDTIEINYPDYVYRAKVLLKNDTLIMNSKEYNQAKYWKFKE
ncbi:hypothetical protein [Flavobacterium sp.]|uniref:hypothetical protein n=1 Tax=Flavobacterium sp. TaxID=239 RepID=UPI0025BADD42|nr:hypothetical protein [Flavobacterium sp.]